VLEGTAYQAVVDFGVDAKDPSKYYPFAYDWRLDLRYNAKLLRDQAGNNLDYFTNSITLGGGEALDVILDTSIPKPDGTAYQPGEVYYLYTPNLDHLSNDAENFGGLMTEVHIN